MDERYLGNDVYVTKDSITNSDIVLSVRGVNAITDRIYLDALSILALIQFIEDMWNEAEQRSETEARA